MGIRANKSIREAVKAANLKLWEVAAAVGVSEGTITRWLRFELTADRRALVEAAIERLAGRKV